MEDLRRAVAFIFNREGTRRMARRDMTLAAAMDLHWFGPQDAERLVDAALRGGLLLENGGKLELTFDPTTVAMPVDFRPGRAILAGGSAEDVVLRVAEQISRLKGIERVELLRRINSRAKAGNIEAEAAALLVAAEEAADVGELAAHAREAVVARAAAKKEG
ncbi:MAG TPA: DUF2240 family protein [Thermoplasmata archaeon]|nr:DUF2240 family protein [Thermoplasmata archaeon]